MESKTTWQRKLPKWWWIAPVVLALIVGFVAFKLLQGDTEPAASETVAVAETSAASDTGSNAAADTNPDTTSSTTLAAKPPETAAVSKLGSETSSETGSETSSESTVAAGTSAKDAFPIEAAASLDGKKVALKGVISSDTQRSALVTALKTVYGDDNVIDDLSIVGPSSPAQDARVIAFGNLLKLSATTMSGATARVSDSELSIKGTAYTEGAKNDMDAFMAEADGTSTLTVAAATSVAEVQENLADILARSGIQFDTNSAVIKTDSFPILDNAVASITREFAAFPTITIEVAGHTDNVGGDPANQQLSQSRSQAVLDYLASKGVDAKRLTAKGYGATKPIADNNTEIARATNRRIELTVSGS
jgi:outer membrane protein OmpA-like peptidoglycan-associated protein